MKILFLLGFVTICFLLTFYSSDARKNAGFKIMLLVIASMSSLLIISPNIINETANFLGIGRGADLVFYLFMISSVFIIARIYLNSKRLEEKLSKIARELSIIKSRNNRK